MLQALGVPEEKFAATCVLVDKLEKVRQWMRGYLWMDEGKIARLPCLFLHMACDVCLYGRCRWSRSAGTWRRWVWRSRWCCACWR